MAGSGNVRMSAEIEGDFVVFIIGMRVNRWWRVDAWLPVVRAMLPMVRELEADPELGLLAAQVHGTTLVQYWRSVEHLNAYAADAELRHRPAWTSYFKRAKKAGRAVGIWHETFQVRAGEYEALFVNMPRPYGVGKAGELVPAVGHRRTASGRFSGRAPADKN